MIDDEIPTGHIGKRSKVNMPEISAQGKTSDPFRTVNCSIRPFVGNRRIEERVSTQEEPSASSWRRQSLRIVKKNGRSSGRRCILAIPFFALGDVQLETVCSWKIPRRAGHRNTHFLKGSPNVPIYL